MSMGLSLGLSLSGPRVGTSTPVAGASPTTFAIAPTVQYHPNSQNATLNGSNQVLDCADLLGLAGVVGVAAIGANTIKNPKMVGVVAGTPGTLPTNWSIGGAAGLTTSVIGTGTEKGMAYVDIRLNGTTSGTFTTILMEAASVIAAVNAQAWSGSATLSVVGGSQTNISSIALTTNVLDVGAAILQHISTTAAVTGTATRFTNSGTTANASTAFVRPLIGVNYSSGVAIDVTLRIAYPALEQAAAATTPATIGPVQMTDALGRKFWRFTGSSALIIANALNALNMRQMMVFAVWRCAKVRMGTDWALLSLRYSAYTNETTNTSQTNGYILRGNAATSTNEVARLKSGTVDSFTATNGGRFIPGAQMHVVGFNSRITANGGGRFYINQDAGDVAQTSLTATGGTCMIIGGKATTSNAVTGTADNCFDLYELAVWKGIYTNGQSDAAAAAMQTNWGIPNIDGQYIIDGDSIAESVAGNAATIDPQSGLAHWLAAPGAGLLNNPSFRVINAAVSGSGVAAPFAGISMTAQRDDPAGPLIYLYPGGPSKNIITTELGINDMRTSGGALAAATHYATMVALLNTTTTGYLQRGFKVVVVTPTAYGGDAAGMTRLTAYRDLIVDPNTDVIVPQFQTDTASQAGGAFDGLVSVLPLCKAQASPYGTLFLNAADTSDANIYNTNDNTHLKSLGYQYTATGGDTPQYGYGAVL